ncbi:MAG: AAA family ATPase [Nannocystaceae bacterium]
MGAASGFPGVRGHEAVQARLSRAMSRGRLHHALMFVGLEGVGKAMVARAMACALTCRVEPHRGCGRCVSCRRFIAGRHPDLEVVTAVGKGSVITAAQAEEVALRCMRAPYEAGAHVVVLDPADRLNEASANKLLKAIEEPREGVYFVLVTDNVGAMISTLVSRCMVVNFAGLADSDVAGILDDVVARDESVLAPKRRALAISLAGGRPGAALRLARDTRLEAFQELVGELIVAGHEGPRRIFAGASSSLWRLWGEAVVSMPDDDEPASEPEDQGVVVVKGKLGKKRSKKKVGRKKAGSKKGSETPAKQRAAAAQVADLWLLHLRERLVGHAGLDGIARGRDDMATLAAEIRVVQRFQAGLRRNPNVRLALEQVLLELSQ